MVSEIVLSNRRIGGGHPCFIIAEAGVNHNGNLQMAHDLVDAAANAGADAVKFQTFRADRLVTKNAPKADYQIRTTGEGESQHAMLKRLELSDAAHRDLMDHCRKVGLLFASTPFDETSAAFLAALGAPFIKIPSGEVTNLEFLTQVAGLGKPIVLSTGTCYIGEVEAAVRAIRSAGSGGLALLHCVSSYPAAPSDVNLRAMETLRAAFSVPVGYSDHTPGSAVALAAVALGACIIEKHFTLDRSLPGPDHRMSVEPPELAALVGGIRTVEAALGHGRKEPAAAESEVALVARKSLIAACDLPAGTVLTNEMLEVKRPGSGIPPAMRPYVVGRRVRQDVAAGTPLSLDLLC